LTLSGVLWHTSASGDLSSHLAMLRRAILSLLQ
jgi:hypothetical protein